MLGCGLHRYLVLLLVSVPRMVCSHKQRTALHTDGTVHQWRMYTQVTIHPYQDVVKTFTKTGDFNLAWKNRRQGTPNSWSHLNYREAYTLETSVLRRFGSVPSPCGSAHLPRMLSSNDTDCTMTTSWDGVSLNATEGCEAFCRLPIESVRQQARCIDEHLRLANVTHGDMTPDGKNMLVNGTRLVLYDFDIATLDHQPALLHERNQIRRHKHGSPPDVLIMLEQFRRANCGSSGCPQNKASYLN